MTPDDKSELNPDQIAQEFNRRKWRGRGDWAPGNNYPYVASRGPYTNTLSIVNLEDARALVVGWQAMEELAAAQSQLHTWAILDSSARTALENGGISTNGVRLDWCVKQLTTRMFASEAQLAALTAENERLKAEHDDALEVIANASELRHTVKCWDGMQSVMKTDCTCAMRRVIGTGEKS